MILPNNLKAPASRRKPAPATYQTEPDPRSAERRSHFRLEYPQFTYLEKATWRLLTWQLVGHDIGGRPTTEWLSDEWAVPHGMLPHGGFGEICNKITIIFPWTLRPWEAYLSTHRVPYELWRIIQWFSTFPNILWKILKPLIIMCNCLFMMRVLKNELADVGLGLNFLICGSGS